MNLALVVAVKSSKSIIGLKQYNEKMDKQ